MDNFLENGAVLPSGLLSSNEQSAMSGFNKTYRNFPLRVGVVVKAYDVSDSHNHSKLTTEYDVQVMEQNEDKGSTSILYRNCMSSEGMGSIADFFERTLRVQKKKFDKGSTNLSGQDGAIVLLLCLDGMSDKAIIISFLTHPDRKTTLTGSDPYLQGEYNGVNVVINKDGSTTLTFKGATDNEGKVIDSSQGNTVVKIEQDGSFQINHSKITFRLDKSGDASLTANKDVNVTAQGNITFQIQGNATVNAGGNISAQAGGNIEAKSGGNTDVTVGGTCNVKSSGPTSVVAPQISFNAPAGQVLTNVTDPVVDLITGFPTQGVPTVKAG